MYFPFTALFLVCLADEANTRDDSNTKTIHGKDVSARIQGRSGKIMIVRDDKDDKDDDKDGRDRDINRDSDKKDSKGKKDKDRPDANDKDDKDGNDDDDNQKVSFYRCNVNFKN